MRGRGEPHPRARRPRAARARGVLPLLAGAALLSGCISEQREMALGDQIAAHINAQVPLVQDGPLNLYVNDLGRMIARHSERPELSYRFYIIDTQAMNAFALPGGHVYVNRGLIERTRNVSELAGVLAHEIGHVAARHGAKNLQRRMRTGSMASFLYQMILNREPILDQEALGVGGDLWFAANSRRDEREADRLAVGYLVQSGVDPKGMVSLFEALIEEERVHPEGEAAGWFSTHPATAERLRFTRRHIGEVLPVRGPALAIDNASYPQFLRRLRTLPPAPMLLPVPHPGP
ncbi:MAG TPA: M48 family metallopeptidase [Longimicrobiaceae bacterium]|nr:M48 family metallopeptidase [Longimicrobiaceae bacterium]